jgi:hypothetical protein
VRADTDQLLHRLWRDGADTDEWQAFLELMMAHDVVMDPSLAVVEETVGGSPPVRNRAVLRSGRQSMIAD